MESAGGNNAGLMRRIVQLEAEKSELQRDIEKLCMQQSSFSGGNDVFSRMQTRSTADMDCQSMTDEGLDQTTAQEVEACKQKLAFHAKESLSLQEELAEAYRAKGKVADAFKATMDKNKELEKEVKYYQSRMAAAFCERDKVSLEIEKVQAKEKSMIKEIADLRHSLEDTREEYLEKERSYEELETSMQTVAEECQRAQEVIDKFWHIREVSAENGFLREAPLENGIVHEEPTDRVRILLDDLDESWVYSSVYDTTVEDSHRATELALEDLKEEFVLAKASAAKLEEELSFTRDTESSLVKELALVLSDFTKLKEDLEMSTNLSSRLAEELRIAKAMALEESHARREAEQKHLTRNGQMDSRRSDIEEECKNFRAEHATLKTMISTFVEEEKGHFLQMEEWLQNLLGRVRATEQKARKDVHVEEGMLPGGSPLQASVVREDTAQDLNTDNRKDLHIEQQNNIDITEDDSKKILAQAMQEKMEALLLLSQQEERYLLEAATQSALESEIRSLHQKLAQVTGEKVIALMELAEERKQLREFRDRERDLLRRLGSSAPSTTGLGGSSQAIEGASRVEDAYNTKVKQKATSSANMKGGWWKGLDISSLKTVATATYYGSGLPSRTSSGRSEGNDTPARLLVENTALRERVASIEHLAQSANRLRMLLIKVAAETMGELATPEIQSAIEVVDSVKAEAEHLAATLGSPLPISFQSPLENVSGVSRGKAQSEGPSDLVAKSGNASRQDRDSVHRIEVEVAELLLALAEVHAESLLTRLNLASID